MEKSSKLERFDVTLNELEGELGKLKGVAEAYTKLQELVNAYKTITRQLEEYGKTVEELVLQQVKKHQEIEAALAEIEEANNANFEKLKELNAEADKSQSAQIEQLRKENKSFYLDFERTLKIQLEENKSEIKRLIEEERQKIKELVEAEMEKRFHTLLSSQRKTQTTVLIFGIATLLALIAVIVNLFFL